MIKSDDNILCEDCNENYISKDRYNKYGICLSCQRRKTIAKTTGNPYVKYVDLPQSEKDRLTKQREVNNRWFKKKNAEKKLGEDKQKLKKLLAEVEMLPDELLVKKFLDKYKYSSLSSVCLRSTDLYNKFIKYCNTERYQVISVEEFNKILKDKFDYNFGMSDCLYVFKGMNNDEWLDYMVDRYDNKKERPLRSNQIYTPELIEEIKSTANNEITTTELRQIFIDKYPALNITTANFNNIMARHKIPHASRGGGNKVKETVIVNPAITNKLKSEDVSNNNDIKVEEPLDVQGVSEQLQEKHIISKELDEDGDPIRLVPVKEEVVAVLDERFKKENARNKFNYTVDDYINMLEMFEYLSANIDGLIRCRDKQFNIVNDYQFDIVHEMENELAEEGNTYLQDKMYVMRDYRRYMEIDYKALKQLRPVLKLIKTVLHPSNPNNTSDLKSISGCINSLKQIISENAQPKFVPRVDVGMTKKYDWAINKNSTYKKAVSQQTTETEAKQFVQNNIVTDNVTKIHKEEDYSLGDELDKIDKQLNGDKSIGKGVQLQDKNIKINESLKKLNSNVTLSDEEIKKGFAVYRVSCRISGGGFGVFRPWYKDYSCIREEMAMAFAQQEFAKMKAKNGQLLFSELECHKLNIT